MCLRTGGFGQNIPVSGQYDPRRRLAIATSPNDHDPQIRCGGGMQRDRFESFAAEILAQLGETPRHAGFLAQGSTSRVWEIWSDRRAYVLRVIEAPDRALSAPVDRFLRKSLSDRGGRVACPVLSSDQTGTLWQGNPWVLEPLLVGSHPARGALPAQVSRALGQTLAALHQVPVHGFGRPARIEGECIHGATSDPVVGVLQRFEHPLSAHWAQGLLHPAFAAAPELEAGTRALLHEVTRQMAEQPPVLCHTDLHERQLICDGDRLVGLLDFGDATLLDPHWDLGSVLYFHGDRNFRQVFEAYQGSARLTQCQPDLAAAFSVAIALHHAARSRLPGKEHRLTRAVAHIRQVIAW
ncbi:aminoglycoside phosphotransferase family protein [Ruegeria sp. 2012CJ41-6]|uniref:Aminoglycoside phosphotransferase family protein n=1 Tax=Ruegeria spongiae TaxID=2942209 RepID=A0ABT0PZY7_9RHOB|nr:aminoglycoside phosphotransferase family protein [Ruegeria spongiae]MCL6283194.1 aminoglycoside phosphotransferase family protein [Ruegeria spongiae]